MLYAFAALCRLLFLAMNINFVSYTLLLSNCFFPIFFYCNFEPLYRFPKILVLPKYFLFTFRKIIILPKFWKLVGAIAPLTSSAGTAMMLPVCNFLYSIIYMDLLFTSAAKQRKVLQSGFNSTANEGFKLKLY